MYDPARIIGIGTRQQPQQNRRGYMMNANIINNQIEAGHQIASANESKDITVGAIMQIREQAEQQHGRLSNAAILDMIVNSYYAGLAAGASACCAADDTTHR